MDRGQKITVPDSVKVLEMIARDEIAWRGDDFWGYQVPAEIPGVELERFDLNNFYTRDEITARSEELMRERLDWLARFPGLDRDIIGALES